MLKRNARWRDRQSGCGQFPTPTFPSPNPMRDPVPLPSRRAVGGVAVAEGGEDVIHVVLRGLPGDHPHEQLRLLRRRRRRLLHVPPRPLEPHRDRTGVWDRTEAHLAPSPLPTHHATEIRKVGRVERWGKPGGKEMAPSLGPSVPSQSVGRTYPGGRGGGGDGPDGRVLVRVVVHRGGVWARPGSNSNPTGWVRDRQGNLPGPHSGGGFCTSRATPLGDQGGGGPLAAMRARNQAAMLPADS